MVHGSDSIKFSIHWMASYFSFQPGVSEKKIAYRCKVRQNLGPQCNIYNFLKNLIPYRGIYFFSLENFFALLEGLRHNVKCFSFSMYFSVIPTSICVMVLNVIR
uniref:Homologue of woodchuck and ground squirrel hepatitis virus DNA polymerase n=1 Tax=African swine fever virus TaxID=10497 RepID=Q8V9T8_ASF|nr:homologue of woodchuck and ground squirrel hepatitis virus DNA polymerase [African swine fever virus]